MPPSTGRHPETRVAVEQAPEHGRGQRVPSTALENLCRIATRRRKIRENLREALEREAIDDVVACARVLLGMDDGENT